MNGSGVKLDRVSWSLMDYKGEWLSSGTQITVKNEKPFYSPSHILLILLHQCLMQIQNKKPSIVCYSRIQRFFCLFLLPFFPFCFFALTKISPIRNSKYALMRKTEQKCVIFVLM